MPLPSSSPTSTLIQRSESPPGGGVQPQPPPLSHLLHSRPPPASLQRSSPPPIFQNLSSIREDSADSADPPEQEPEDAEMVDVEEEEGRVQGSGVRVPPPSLLPPSSLLFQEGQGGGRLVYSGTPQISITDTQGHVTDLDPSQQDEASRVATAAAPPPSSPPPPPPPPSSPSHSPSSSPSSSSSSLPSSHHHHHHRHRRGDSSRGVGIGGIPCSLVGGISLAGGLSSYPFSFLQGFGLINTNLASIPPSVYSPLPNGGDSPQAEFPPMYPWNQPSLRSNQRSNSRWWRRHRNLPDSGGRDGSSYHAQLASAAPLSEFALGGGGVAVNRSNVVPGALHHVPPFTSTVSSSPSSPTSRGSPLGLGGFATTEGGARFPGFFSQPSSPQHQASATGASTGAFDLRESLSSPPSPLNSCFSLDPYHHPHHHHHHHHHHPPSCHSDSSLFQQQQQQQQQHALPQLFTTPSPPPPPHPSSHPYSSPSPSSSPHHHHHHPSPSSPVLGRVEKGLDGGVGVGSGSACRLLELGPSTSGGSPRTAADVVAAIEDALEAVCPSVAYEKLEKRFRLQQDDLEMEVEVCDGEGEIPAGLHVRKLSGDHTHYAALCNHLLACVNN